MVVRYFIIGTVLPFVANSQFISRLNVNQCQSCCGQAEQEFDQVNIDIGACNNGCAREVGADQLCSDLFPGTNLDDPDRLGCEIGRDFLSTGVTAVLEPNQIIQCDRFTNLETVNLVIPNQQDFEVGANDCTTCCDTANDLFDGGNNNLPDDFGRAACQTTCATPAFCFDQQGHRERTGCLIALDFLSQGITTIDQGILTCDNDGNVELLDLTDFPTKSPTTSPILSTGAPTALKDDQPDLLLFGGAAGGIVGLLLLSLIFILVFRKRKRKPKREAQFLDERKMTLTYDVSPMPEYSQTPSNYTASHGDINGGQVVIKIEIPAAEASRNSFDIYKFLPPHLRKASGSSNGGSTVQTPVRQHEGASVLTPVRQPENNSDLTPVRQHGGSTDLTPGTFTDIHLNTPGSRSQNNRPRYHLSTSYNENDQEVDRTEQETLQQSSPRQYPPTPRFPRSWNDNDEDSNLSDLIRRAPTF